MSHQAVLCGRQSFYSPLPPGSVCFLKVMIHWKTKALNMQKLWYGVLFYVLWRFLITLAMPGSLPAFVQWINSFAVICWLTRWCVIYISPLQGEWLRAACERCGRVWSGSQPGGGSPEGGGACGAAAGPTEAGPARDDSGGQPAEGAQRSGTHPTYHKIEIYKFSVRQDECNHAEWPLHSF